MRLTWLASLSVACLVFAGCAGGSSDGEGVTPIELSIPRSSLPSPGFCRVWVSGTAVSRQALQRSCDGIEWTAPLGARILYRPDDGSREVHVRYMSRGTRGFVTGIDAFDIDTMRLKRVIMPYTGETDTSAAMPRVARSS